MTEPAAANDEDGGGGELQLFARFLDPTEAWLLHGRLRAEGIAAVVADAHLVQTYSLLAIAVGGVRLLVPAAQIEAARAVHAALERGDYALPDEPGEDGDEASR